MTHKFAVTLAVAALASVSATSSSASVTTTGPGSELEIYVKLNDSRLALAIYALSAYAGNEIYLESRANVVRGDVAVFKVTNDGKKPHNFVFLGKKTPTLKPGAKASFIVSLLRRGSFPYDCTVNPTAGLRGALVVH